MSITSISVEDLRKYRDKSIDEIIAILQEDLAKKCQRLKDEEQAQQDFITSLIDKHFCIKHNNQSTTYFRVKDENLNSLAINIVTGKDYGGKYIKYCGVEHRTLNWLWINGSKQFHRQGVENSENCKEITSEYFESILEAIENLTDKFKS